MSTNGSMRQLRGLPVWSASEVQGVAIRHQAELMKRAGGNHEAAVKMALEILLDHDLISQGDLEVLSELVDAVEGSKEEPDRERLTAIHDRLVLRRDSTTLSIVIAGIAEKRAPEDDSEPWEKIIGMTVMGAVTGMYIGEGAGFPELGAVAGATAGAAVAQALTKRPRSRDT